MGAECFASYERQVADICLEVLEVEGVCVLPQAVSPSVSSGTSGTAICPVVAQDDCLSAGSQQHNEVAAGLPELPQLAGSQHALQAHILSFRLPQQQDQHSSSSHLGIKAPHHGLHRNSSCSSGATLAYKPSSWVHPGLQLFLHELEQSQWTASAAAGAARPQHSSSPLGIQQPASLALLRPAAALCSSSSDAGNRQNQHVPAAQALLAWLRTAHPWAGGAADSYSNRMLRGITGTGSTAPRNAARPTDEHCAASEDMQQRDGGQQRVKEDEGNDVTTAGCEPAEEQLELQQTSDPAPQQSWSQQHSMQQQQQQGVLPCVAHSLHPNVQPVLHITLAAGSSSDTISSSSSSVCLLTHHVSTDAAAVLRHCPGALGGDWHLRFLIHQLLHGLAALHSRGIAMGGFTLDQLVLICPGWLQLLVKPSGCPVLPEQQQQQQQLAQSRFQQEQQRQQQLVRQWCMVVYEPHYTLPQLTDMWRRRVISNFEYLMWVNTAAGRGWGDRKRHPFVPWVVDFSTSPLAGSRGGGSSSSSSPPPGWRDLGISQYRRIKGDAQLDQTYAMSAAAAAAAGASPAGPWSGCVAGAPGAAAAALQLDPWAWQAWDGSSGGSSGGAGFASGEGGVGVVSAAVQPHHISNEPMSELSYAIYMARRLPVQLLVQLVRRSFRPGEYPASLEGLYHSSPDEALPQFYCDPHAFKSTHHGMQDLAVPGWAQDAEHFVHLHRAALESDYVSANLHKWLDLNFGVALSGPAGLAAKNIHLGSTDSSSSSSRGSTSGKVPAAAAGGSGVVVPGVEPSTRGVYQLFQLPHPARSSRHHATSSSDSSRAVLRAVANSAHSVGNSSLQQCSEHLQQCPPSQDPQSASNQAAAPAAPATAAFAEVVDSGSSQSSSAADLAACWAELQSLSAAAAVGAWTPGTPGLVSTQAAGTHHTPSLGLQQQQQAIQPHSSTSEQELQGSSDQSVGCSSSRRLGCGGVVLLPAEAAAADLAALGQVALQLYNKQQQAIALGASAGHFAAEQCWQYCSSSSCCYSSHPDGSSSSSKRGMSLPATGSHQTRAGLQSGSRQPNVPPAVSLFVQQCGSGSYSAAELLKVSSFLPAWMDHARHFMLQLLFTQHTPEVQQQQQQQLSFAQEEQGGATDCEGSSSPAAAAAVAGFPVAAWQLADAFERLSQLSVPCGALEQLARDVPQALQVCLPAILHVIRGRLLHGVDLHIHGSTSIQQHRQGQQQALAASGRDVGSTPEQQLQPPPPLPPQQQQQQPQVDLHQVQQAAGQQQDSHLQSMPVWQQQQHQALLLLEASCSIIFRLSTVLTRLQVQQHFTPLLAALLNTEAGDMPPSQGLSQQVVAANGTASAAAADSPSSRASAGPQPQQHMGDMQQQQVLPAGAVCAAVGRRAVLQPSLWHVLVQKLAQQQLLSVLLPPLLAAVLEPQQDWLSAAAVNNGTTVAQQQVQQHADQAELACSCVAVLAENLPFPVVAQHILRPLMLALPAGGTSPPNTTTVTTTTVTTTTSSNSSSQGVVSGAGGGVAQPISLATAGTGNASVTPAFRAAVGLLAVARVLPQQLVEEFVFRPMLQLALLPLQTPKTLSAAAAAAAAAPAGAATAVGEGQSDSGAVCVVGQPSLAALPVLEGLLLSLLPVLKAASLLPPSYSAAEQGTSAGLGSPKGATAAGTAGLPASDHAAVRSSTERPLDSSSSSSIQNQSYAAVVSAAPAASTATGAAAVQDASGAAKGLPAFWRLAELLLTPPEASTVVACTLVYPRIAALLLLGMEYAIIQAQDSSSSSTGASAGSSADNSASVSATAASAAADPASSASGRLRDQLVGLYGSWVLPVVLLPLLDQPLATAWGVALQQEHQQTPPQQQDHQQQTLPEQQQQQQQLIRQAYWHTVLLLYAASVHHLGLAAVRAAVPNWHSTEVWLLAETGWEPSDLPATGPAAAGPPTVSPVLQLLTALAVQRTCRASSADQQVTSSPTCTLEVLQQVGLLVGLQLGSSTAASGALLTALIAGSNGQTGSTTAGARPVGVQELLAQGSSTSSSAMNKSSSNQIAGRVTHLLQRIAEEKVVRRSLNTTHEFMEGVGWSLPRPTTPTGVAAAANSSSVAAVAPADSSGLVLQQHGSWPPQKGAVSLTGDSPANAASGGESAMSPGTNTSPTKPQQPTSAQSDMQHSTSAASSAVGLQPEQPAAASAGAVTSPPAANTLAGPPPPFTHGPDRCPASAPSVMAATDIAVGARQEQQQLSAAASRHHSSQEGMGSALASGDVGGKSWAAELSQLRSLLETPTRPAAAERGPSAGKEWFWLRGNPKLAPSHLLPDFAAGSSSSNSSGPQFQGSWHTSGSRLWDAGNGMWWEEGWKLGAVCLHSWPAHREKLRALAVDPWERLLVTAGRGGAREAGGGSSSGWVVRVWELADAEAKMQYTSHTAAVHQVTFLGPCSSAVASLDVSGAIHVWDRTTGSQLQAFCPVDLSDTGVAYTSSRATAASATLRPLQSFGASSSVRSAEDSRAAAVGAAGPIAGVSGGASAAGSTRVSRDSLSVAAAGAGAAGDSRRCSVSLGAAGADLAFADPLAAGDAAAAVAAAGGAAGSVLYGGYWERGCSSGRGWQALTALPTSQQLAAGGAAAGGGSSTISPGSLAAAGGMLDVAGAGSLRGPGWPLSGGHLGYTCMAPVDSNHALVEALALDSGGYGSSSSSNGGGSPGLLLAGTADGHVCLLDVETGALLEDSVACWDPRPRLFPGSSARGPQQQQLQQQQQVQANPLLSTAAGPAGWDGITTAAAAAAADPSYAVLSAVCHSSRAGPGAGSLGGWVGAGSGGGRITLLDMRAGVVVGTWQAHSQRVSQLQGLGSTHGEHMLLSCSADKTMKLWDLRMMPQAAAPHASLSFSSAVFGGNSFGGNTLAAPLTTYKSGRDGIEGFVVYQDAAIVYGGASLGLAPLELKPQLGSAAGGGAGGMVGQQQQQQGGSVQTVRMTPVRGVGHRGAGGREGLVVAAASSVVGLGLLPHSKLLAVGTEDGLVRICR